MESFFSKGFIEFVERRRATFLIIVLIAAVVYQYLDNAKQENKYFEENKRLHERNIELVMKNLEYERKRSEKLEYLLNNLNRNTQPQNFK